MTEHGLTHREFFDFSQADGSICRGANQEWYRDSWQKKAGCGPTTAATIMAYLSQYHETLAPIGPEGMGNAEDFVDYMEAVWDHVTPTNRGLNSLALFYQGSVAFARSRNTTLYFQELDIPGLGFKGRPDWETCSQFLTKALDQNLPVAFLNFSNGKLRNLDSWHWVPIISAVETQDDRLLCSILDEGEERIIDFHLWYESTRFGGGLVVLSP